MMKARYLLLISSRSCLRLSRSARIAPNLDAHAPADSGSSSSLDIASIALEM